MIRRLFKICVVLAFLILVAIFFLSLSGGGVDGNDTIGIGSDNETAASAEPATDEELEASFLATLDGEDVEVTATAVEDDVYVVDATTDASTTYGTASDFATISKAYGEIADAHSTTQMDVTVTNANDDTLTVSVDGDTAQEYADGELRTDEFIDEVARDNLPQQ